MVELVLTLRSARSWFQFLIRGFAAPYPNFLKMQVLKNHACHGAGWIETGTYEGSTSKYLSKRFPMVVTIEPSETFYTRTKTRLSHIENINFIYGTSEQCLKEALESISDNVNIWLDGHFSEGATFLGNAVTPILSELSDIEDALKEFDSVTLFVDDVRLFGDESYSGDGYPQFSLLTDWCEKNNFSWQVKRDILIAKFSRVPQS